MHLTLRSKFLLYFVGFLTVSLLLLAKSLFDQQHDALLGEMQKRLAIVASNLSLQAREAMETNDELSILASLRARREANDCLEAAVFHSNGSIFAHSDVRRIGRDAELPIEVKLLQEGFVYVEVPKSFDSAIQVWAPVTSDLGGVEERIGLVSLTFSKLPLNEAIRAARWTVIRVGALFILLGIVGTALITRTITKPIGQLVRGVQRIANGDLKHKMRLNRSDEIGLLSDSFDHMTDRLESAQEELLKQQLYEKELELAGKIQSALLPEGPPQSERFSVAALSVPARIVGGDFYDYIQIPAGGTAFLVADVAGKGVSAGLVMTAVRSAARNVFQRTQSPREAMVALNQLVLRDFDRKTFVTMLIMVLDRNGRKLTIANAGQPPVLHYQAATGTCQKLDLRSAAVGVLPSEQFAGLVKEHLVELEIGDLVLGYTDGVNEAHDAEGNLYGEDRILEFGLANAQSPPVEFLSRLRKEIETFAQGFGQFDDITALALKPSMGASNRNRHKPVQQGVQGVTT